MKAGIKRAFKFLYSINGIQGTIDTVKAEIERLESALALANSTAEFDLGVLTIANQEIKKMDGENKELMAKVTKKDEIICELAKHVVGINTETGEPATTKEVIDAAELAVSPPIPQEFQEGFEKKLDEIEGKEKE